VNRITKLSGLAESQTHHTISRKTRQLEKFRSLIDRDFRKQHSLQIYANEIGVTVGHLRAYVVKFLVDLALRSSMLVSFKKPSVDWLYTSISIQQLAHELGFDDDAYFARFFKETHWSTVPKPIALII
jgi:AraC family transcriptional activator of pobA